MDQTSICPNCHQPIPPTSQFCGACGYLVPKNRLPSRVWLVAAGVAVLALAVVAVLLLAKMPEPEVLTFEEQLAEKGGLEMFFEAETSSISAQELDQAAEVMRQRLKFIGVSASSVQVLDGKRIQVQVVGASDLEALIPLLKKVGLVEFVDTGSTPIEPGTLLYTDLDGPPFVTPGPTDKIYHTILTGSQVASATVSTNSLGKYQIDLVLNEQGKQILADFTRNNIGKYLTISYDRVCVMSPNIATEIQDGNAVIQGNLTFEEANRIAAALNTGTLPAPFKLVESRVIDPATP